MGALAHRRVAVAQTDFESFYKAQYPQVYRGVYLATSDPDAAFDATQEAFKRAYARWWRLSRHEWAGGWVMTTALNVAKRHGRRSSEEAASASPRIASYPGPSANRIDVTAALQKLPARQRTATILYYLGDQPLPTIASVMGVSEGTVKAHLAQARKKLRETLEVVDV